VWRSKTIKSRWTRVAGLRVHARVALDQAGPNAPAVVLVHGIGVASPYFVPTAEQLAPHFRSSPSTCPGSD
jgi:2-hydroxy-6-oxonona-2,4-dienedioate hydrolase